MPTSTTPAASAPVSGDGAAPVADEALLAASSDLVVRAARLVRSVRRDARGGSLSVPPAGARVLSLLDEHGPTAVGRLAELDGCAQPTMTGVVTALVQRGWVRKAPDPTDARTTLVDLTDDGAAALADTRAHHARVVAARVAAHGRHDVRDVAAAAALLLDVLTPEPRTERTPTS